MSRNYASVYLTIWSDPDFRALPWKAQWLYFTMLTHPTLSACGVMDWRESRLVNMAENITVRELRDAAWQLGERRLIAVDPDTEEALVRSFVRHDGTLKSPNMTKKMVGEYGAIASVKLMELVTIEARRAVEEHPDWKGVELVVPITKQFPNSSGNPSDLVPDWFHFSSETVPDSFQNRSLKTGSKTGNPSDLVSPLHLHQHPIDKSIEGDASDDEEAGSKEGGSSEPTTTTKRKRPSTPIPANWKPSDSHASKARELGLDLQWQADQFRDKNLAKDNRYVDWDKAFFTWLRNAARFEQRDGTSKLAPAQNWLDNLPVVGPGHPRLED